MATAAPRSRPRGRIFTVVVRIALALAVLAPASVLFSLVWSTGASQSADTNLERHGIEYLQTLGPLEIALTDAQAAAVAGSVPPREAVIRALDAMSKVDDRLGDGLRTKDRWAELRTKIEALPTGTGQPATAATAYGETTDLLLALVDKVRTNSTLIRDPSADAYYLEDGAAQELPEAVVAATQYTTLATLAIARPAAQPAATLADLISARDSLSSNAQDLADDIRSAVDGTDSRTLGSSLLSKVDRFSRSVETLAPAATLAQGKLSDLDLTKLAAQRTETQQAAADLSNALLNQIDGLLRSRAGDLNRRLALAIGLLALVAVAALAPVLVVGRRRRTRGGERPPSSGGTRVERTERERVTVPPAGWPERPPLVTDPEFARWEQYGAAR